jgi:hypothetical protein
MNENLNFKDLVTKLSEIDEKMFRMPKGTCIFLTTDYILNRVDKEGVTVNEMMEIISKELSGK